MSIKEQVAANANIVILGFGVTGQSVARFYRRIGVEPIVLDTRDALPVPDAFADLEVRWRTQRWPQDLQRLQEEGGQVRCVLSPGLALDSCLVTSALAAGVEVVSDIDVFFEHCSNRVFGITGTNGKSTVTELVAHLLNTAGKACVAGGNLGRAALDLLEDDAEFYALELSSFQLERSRAAPLEAAVILNVSEDHLDLHGDMQSYIDAKQRIFANAERRVWVRSEPHSAPRQMSPSSNTISVGLDAPDTDSDWGVVEADGVRRIHRGAQAVIDCAELALSGPHNELNAMAAAALVGGEAELEDVRTALKDFSGLPHRLEFVADVKGVRFINDSKATNVGATLAALSGMKPGRTVLIAGGDAKGVDMSPLEELLESRVRHLVVIGKDGPALLALAQRAGVPSSVSQSLDAAVERATAIAVDGDAVLLSPACASLDMFTNYAERGEQFKTACLRHRDRVERGEL